MPRILQLDPHVADLIAAGEVVERPSSVVKELMENCIDAGAGIITVEVSAGGMTYIRVTDNGCGIAPDDVKTAFMRHATSKLRGAEGLEAIGTLGFRGEALAAIAAVSRVELLTREQGAGEGVGLSLEAGEVVDFSPIGCPEGTTIIVRDLFFNTPARLKFMKTDRAEGSAIASAVLRSALSHPEVSVRFVKDGKTEFHTPGDSLIESCIYSLFGREFSAGLIKTESSDEAVSVHGFVSAPDAARGNRSYQFFFINGRPVKSMTLQAALEQAYANKLPNGRFPACVLYVSTSPVNVDVNVHPAKTEVKFVSDKQVFDGVYYAALSAIERTRGGANAECRMQNAELSTSGVVGAATEKSGVRNSKSTIGSGFRSMQVEEFRNKYVSGNGGRQDAAPTASQPSLPISNNRYPTPTPSASASASASASNPQRSAPNSQPSTINSQLQTHSLSTLLSPLSSLKVLGEALSTYIIVEYNDSVWFIDKHAAHERLHFNALMNESFEPMSQILITPVICRHGHEEASILLDNAELLDKLGFSVESFGEDSVAVRRIPAEIDIDDTEAVLSDICAGLGHGGKAKAANLDSIFKTIACKAAIKAGRSSGMRELEALAAKVMSGEASHCPHGRPVTFEVTRATLEKSIGRR